MACLLLITVYIIAEIPHQQPSPLQSLVKCDESRSPLQSSAVSNHPIGIDLVACKFVLILKIYRFCWTWHYS